MDARISEAEADTQRRQRERVENIRKAEETKSAADAEAIKMKGAVDLRVGSWARGKTAAEMLSALAAILPDLCGDLPPLVRDAPPADIKRAFHRAVRIIHPDKLAPCVPLETRLVAERVFITLTAALEKAKQGSA
jgi:hypothetical protein